MNDTLWYGVNAHYVTESYQNETWMDISGNNNHATVTGTFGNKTIDPISSLEYIVGTPLTRITFPIDMLGLSPATYTFIHVCKHEPGAQNRIFDGSNINWLSGFHIDETGVAHHIDTWITSRGDRFGLEIVVSTDLLNTYRGNGIDYTIATTSLTTVPYFKINNDRGGFYQQSDFGCFEIIAFHFELSLSQIIEVETYLLNKYIFQPTSPPTEQPKSNSILKFWMF